MKKVEIKLSVTLDENNVPVDMSWVSDDPPSNGKEAATKAFFLSLFDKSKLETLQINLWDKNFEVGEMHRMTYHTLRGLADTFYKGTNDPHLSNDIARFAQYMGKNWVSYPNQKESKANNGEIIQRFLY